MAAADHYDGCFCADGPYDWSHIRNSNAEADELSARYDDGMVLRSIELGEPQWDAEQSRRVIAESNFDVVVGAIHAVKSPMFEDKQLLKRCFSQLKYDELTARQIYDLMDAYYRDNLEMVKTMDIDICAHLTCVVGYFMSRHGIFVGVEQFKPIIREILQVLIDKGIALEVNTSCVGTMGELMPPANIIKAYRDMGGRLVTLGSDAHRAEDGAAYFEEALKVLRDIGFDTLCGYENRQAVRVPI